MTLEIIEKTDKPLLSRTDVVGEIYFDGPIPSRKDIKTGLISKLGAKQELIVIKKIDSSYGTRKATVYASMYKNKKALESISKDYFSKRGVPKEGKSAAEAPKDGAKAPKEEAKPEEPKSEEKPAEEAPKEEVKEAPKTEEKKDE